MPSPFPGMDPYLEDPAFWEDFHRRFITHCADKLGDCLPEHYEARIDERLRLIDVPSERERRILPDVAILHHPETRSTYLAPAAADPGVTTLDPVTIPMATTAEVRDVWIEIIHRPERSIVTVIELLSPTNKEGAGYGEYLAKRRALLDQHVHLVEIDLLAGGERIPLLRPLPTGHYYAYVTRDDRRPYVDVYAWSLRDRLPPVPVPLRAPDPDIILNLAAVVSETYDRGRYLRSLRYNAAPPGPFSSEEAAWSMERARVIPR